MPIRSVILLISFALVLTASGFARASDVISKDTPGAAGTETNNPAHQGGDTATPATGKSGNSTTSGPSSSNNG